MMELFIYSIFDRKAESFHTPFFMVNDHVARRQFELIVNEEGPEASMISKYPEDYILYKIGKFKTIKGVIVPEEVPHEIAQGLTVLKKEV